MVIPTCVKCIILRQTLETLPLSFPSNINIKDSESPSHQLVSSRVDSCSSSTALTGIFHSSHLLYSIHSNFTIQISVIIVAKMTYFLSIGLSTMIVLLVILLCDSVQGRLEKCLTFENPRNGGTKVDIVLNTTLILNHFYKGKGPCKRMIHADSMTLNRICTNFDMHAVPGSLWEKCRKLAIGDKSTFNRCLWNKGNVKSRAVLKTKWAVSGGAVDLQLFDKKDCVKHIEGDLMQIPY